MGRRGTALAQIDVSSGCKRISATKMRSPTSADHMRRGAGAEFATCGLPGRLVRAALESVEFIAQPAVFSFKVREVRAVLGF